MNRLLVKVEFPGTQSGPVALQIDTAAWMTELFPTSHVSLLHLSYGSQSGARLAASGGPGAMAVYEHAAMKIGRTELHELNVAQSRREVVSDAAGLLPAQDTRESVAQLLATLHLTVRDRFRLIAQQVDVHRENSLVGAQVDDSQLVGSLLFTHERSLTRRIYGGVTYSRSTAPLFDERRETAEVFVKLQWGMSSGRGVAW
jgi:hypothetical protein